jgi:hypothetical protein
VDPKRLIFVEESSTNIALTPRYGRAPKNWGKNVTLISSISLEGMGPSMSIEGSSDTESFSLYMRQILAPSLRPGQIVLSWTTYRCTRANGLGNSSKGEDASCGSFPATRPT